MSDRFDKVSDDLREILANMATRADFERAFLWQLQALAIFGAATLLGVMFVLWLAI